MTLSNKREQDKSKQQTGLSQQPPRVPENPISDRQGKFQKFSYSINLLRPIITQQQINNESVF